MVNFRAWRIERKESPPDFSEVIDSLIELGIDENKLASLKMNPRVVPAASLSDAPNAADQEAKEDERQDKERRLRISLGPHEKASRSPREFSSTSIINSNAKYGTREYLAYRCQTLRTLNDNYRGTILLFL